MTAFVAIITSLGVGNIIVALIARRDSKRTKTIVEGNGRGSVLAIVERIDAKVDNVLHWQGQHEAVHARIEGRE